MECNTCDANCNEPDHFNRRVDDPPLLLLITLRRRKAPCTAILLTPNSGRSGVDDAEIVEDGETEEEDGEADGEETGETRAAAAASVSAEGAGLTGRADEELAAREPKNDASAVCLCVNFFSSTGWSFVRRFVNCCGELSGPSISTAAANSFALDSSSQSSLEEGKDSEASACSCDC